MNEICPKCGLPKNLCVCGEIAKESQRIKITTTKRRFGKVVTLVKGFEDEKEAEELGKMLKRQLACGGTVKDDIIELQGNHVEKVKQELIKYGFPKDSISIQK